MDNAEEYAGTRRAMTIVGLPIADQDAIMRIVAAVLHLGNVAFIPDPKEEEACIMADEEAGKHLGWAATLLGVSAEGLNHSLSTRTRQTVDGAAPFQQHTHLRRTRAESRNSAFQTSYV